jgi:hypothetical protein
LRANADDRFGQLVVAPAGHVAPGGRGAPEARRQVVLHEPIVVASHVALVAVEVLQGADQEIAHGVPAEIGRDEAEAKSAVGVADILVRSPGRPKRRGVLPLILGVGLGQLG